jgi:Type IV secretion system pilin
MKKILFTALASIYMLTSLSPLAFAADRFWDALDQSTTSIEGQVDRKATIWFKGVAIAGWAEWVRDAIVYVVKTVIVPLIIIVGVISAIIGLYQVFMSDKEEATKTGMNYIIWWVVGIIIMISASFLVDTIVNQWVFAYSAGGEFLGNVTAQRIYRKLLFPFLKLAMYLVMGALFLITLVRLGEFLQTPKDDIKTQAKTIIQWNAVGILVIIFAKNIIETLYGSEAQVTSKTTTNLGQIGWGILTDKQIPYVYTILNWAMGFIGAFILIVIIVQAVKLLTDPTDEGTQKSLRKNFIYIIIGLIIMGTAYVVTNVLIVH